MKRGKFIVFEGADGSGTTTMTERVGKRLSVQLIEMGLGADVLCTREPSDSDVGQFIRRMFRKEVPAVNREGMIWLFAAQRLVHLSNEILPFLYSGGHVICDRYAPSTWVYQSLLGDVQDTSACRMERMSVVHDMVLSTLRCPGDPAFADFWNVIPDLVILLDADADVLAKRREVRQEMSGTSPELHEDLETQAQVVESYRFWYKDDRYAGVKKMVDASRSLDEVEEDCFELIKEIM